MKKNLIIGAVVVVALIILYFTFHTSSSPYQFVSVTRGTIIEDVSVTGNTAPVNSLDLAFQTGGTVAAVYKNAGDAVGAGDTLVKLDTSGLQAQLAQAQASVDAAQANLAELQAGPTPQSVRVSETAVTTAQQTLLNAYAGVQNAAMAAFAKANDAVRNQISPLYSNAESNSPQLTFSVNNNQTINNADFERVQASQELNTWQAELNGVSAISPTSTLNQLLTNATNHLAIIENLLTTVSTAVVQAQSLSASTATAYQNDVANAVTEVDSAASSINTTSQSIASDIASLAQAEAQLNVTLAGSTSQAIAAQQAQVAEAQANAQNIQVNLANATLSSPINGVVSVQNAKIGEIAAAGQTITSVISSNNLEIAAEVPETDIGKISIGNAVDMTFDAFPGETFPGKVFYIDPAETIVSGVVDYKIKVSFDKSDARIKSGLTANLDIKTQEDDNAFILPQYAVIQNASGTFVEIIQNGSPTQIPVTLGIRDQKGNVEITNGVTEGEQVVNIGLKAQ